MDREEIKMRARRRVRFITGREDTPPGCPAGRGPRVGVGAPATIRRWELDERAAARRRRSTAGFACRLATQQERDEWSQLRDEQCHWLVECRRCAAWAYGDRQIDVRDWGRTHLRSAHPRRAPIKPSAARPASSHVSGAIVRRATSQDRQTWPQLVREQGNWLAECAGGDWAYGVARADVKAWAAKHRRLAPHRPA